MGIPKFTGRNVPIDEIAAAAGLTSELIKDGIEADIFRFGYSFRVGKGERVFYCPDKRVWEETGYFNDKFADGEQKGK